MINWPEQLIKDVARRRAIVMLGSGISKNSVGTNGETPPTWRQFLEEAFEKVPPKSHHIRGALKSGDYLSACEWIRNRMDEQWNPFLVRKFLTPAFQPSELHKAIFSLDASVYVTPNFDKIFDNYVTERTDGTTIIKTYYDEDVHQQVRSGVRLILKVHGTIDSPDKMIFGRGKYAEARVRYAAFYHLVDALLLTNTFLILGCGLNDPDFQLLFENFNYRFPTAAPHYMTSAEPSHDEFDELVRDTRKLKFLKYSRLNNHQELTASIKALASAVDGERQEIAASLNW